MLAFACFTPGIYNQYQQFSEELTQPQEELMDDKEFNRMDAELHDREYNEDEEEDSRVGASFSLDMELEEQEEPRKDLKEADVDICIDDEEEVSSYIF